jgi:hypothetical protein
MSLLSPPQKLGGKGSWIALILALGAAGSLVVVQFAKMVS